MKLPTLTAPNHPHIAQIYSVEESNGARALVMELVDGDTLADRIARERLHPITAATGEQRHDRCARPRPIPN